MRPLSQEECWILLAGILALDFGCVVWGFWLAWTKHRARWKNAKN